MTTTLQTNRPAAPVSAPAPDGIEWAIPAVTPPADKRLDPRPATEGRLLLHPLAAVSSLRQSMSARRARRIARRPELESVFPVGHPGFELRSTTQLALAAPRTAELTDDDVAKVNAAVAALATSKSHATDAVDLDFAF